VECLETRKLEWGALERKSVTKNSGENIAVID
jgi:hypothetical protein